MILKSLMANQRVTLAFLVALVLAIGAYAIVKGQRQPAPIVFHNLPVQPPIASKPVETTGGDVVVDATGAVKKPDVLHLPAGSRVEDAVKAAGGATSDADLEQLNLAAKLVDGTQVFVPRKGTGGPGGAVAETYKGGEVSEPYTAHPLSAKAPSGGFRGKKAPPSQPVSLNSANPDELQSVPGIGPATAQKIIDYRKEHGRFSSVDELAAVKGIGQKRVDAMKKYLKL